MTTYWKITNKEENHYGLQYHDGLMEDTEPFNPSGDCKSGGIYFTDIENIFAFLSWGPWIREVTIPKDARIYENPSKSWGPKKWKANKVFLHPRRRWMDVEVLKELIEKGANIHTDDDWILYQAARNGHLEIVQLLLENGANIHANDDWALRYTATNGHSEVVKLLLENEANIHAWNDWALRWAAANGHLEVVKFLLENGVDVRTKNDWALFLAVDRRDLEMIKVLIRNGADVSTLSERTLQNLKKSGSKKISKFLEEQIEREKGEK